MDIFIQEISRFSYNAGSKARNDVDRILKLNGYKPCFFKLNYKRIKRYLFKIIYAIVLRIKIQKYKKCFIQYPCYGLNVRGSQLPILKFVFGGYKGEIECLLHDIDELRSGEKTSDGLKYVANKCSKLIVHTPAMKDFLIKETGIREDHIRILYLFDYLTDDNISPVDLSNNRIIFAGNLKKSSFLIDLCKLPKSLSFNLYGVYSSNVKESTNCFYKGKFHPNEISKIEGNWGLVWDGDRLDTCHGYFGEYLKFNSSHKISLYLAACKPVIIWKESSLKDFILDNHLGIVVGSLYDIEKEIDKLSDLDKKLIKENVEKCSEDLRAGKFLTKCLNE